MYMWDQKIMNFVSLHIICIFKHEVLLYFISLCGMNPYLGKKMYRKIHKIFTSVNILSC